MIHQKKNQQNIYFTISSLSVVFLPEAHVKPVSVKGKLIFSGEKIFQGFVEGWSINVIRSIGIEL